MSWQDTARLRHVSASVSKSACFPARDHRLQVLPRGGIGRLKQGLGAKLSGCCNRISHINFHILDHFTQCVCMHACVCACMFMYVEARDWSESLPQ